MEDTGVSGCVTNAARFRTLVEAQLACTEDRTCVMVYDAYCDNDMFYVCPTGTPERPSNEGSCVYKKGKIMAILEIIML